MLNKGRDKKPDRACLSIVLDHKVGTKKSSVDVASYFCHVACGVAWYIFLVIPSAVAKLNLIESNLQLNAQHFPNRLSITAQKILYAFIHCEQ